VTEWEIHHDRDPQREQPIPQHILHGLPGIPTVRFGIVTVYVHANRNPGHLLKQTRIKQLGQHSIEAIRFLADLFEKENAVFERGHKWRS